MRFRITKNSDGKGLAIIVTGMMNDEGAWDVLQIAQTMLCMPNCKELLIDLQEAFIDEEVSALHTETLVALFEEGLLRKDSSLIVRFRDASEIRLCSDQMPLKKAHPFSSLQFSEANFFSKTRFWPESKSRHILH